MITPLMADRKPDFITSPGDSVWAQPGCAGRNSDFY
jgi:hypothetical protein